MSSFLTNTLTSCTSKIKIKFVIPVIIFISFAFIFIIHVSLFPIVNDYSIQANNYAYGQTKHSNFSDSNLLNIMSIPSQKVKVGDIYIAYKTLGKGEPILLISGSGNVMDVWPSSLLQKLSFDHQVIIFDNRGVGNSTSGIKPIFY